MGFALENSDSTNSNQPSDWDLPSGNDIQKAIENGHRNSEFTH